MFIQKWFQQNKVRKIGFEDLLYALKNSEQYIIINTLMRDNQQCLIQNTISIDNEESIINEYIN